MMSVRVASGRLQVLQIYRLLQYVHEGDKVQIEKMVKLGKENLINLTEPQDGTGVLHLAVSANNQDLVSFLLSQGAHPNIQDKNGRTPVMLAAELGNDAITCSFARHIRCLQVALKCQVDVNDVSAQGRHVFQLMCEKAQECTPMCLIMLGEGADPNATNQLIQVLSAYAADMGVSNLEDCTALHYAAALGNANCCKFLAQRDFALCSGCNPKLKNQEGLLPRQIAKDAGHKAAVKELKKAERQQGKGRKPDGGDGPTSDLWALTLHDWSYEHETTLRQALGNQSETVTTQMFISVLEELKAPVELDQLHAVIAALDKDKKGCINVSDFLKGVKYIKKPFLLSAYMPKNKKGEKGGKGGKKKGKFVLTLPICTLPPELMARRPDGGPPKYMIETYYNCSDVRRFDRSHPQEHPIMNDSGWYIDKPDKVYVSINYCVKSGDLESLELALNHGVPVDVQDEFYKTPLMVACSSGNYEVAQADVNVCDQFFWTPLHHAAHAGQVEIIQLLVEAGAKIDARALSGGTPLMRAIESFRPSCVDFLIKAGASVNAENKKEQNCLDIARAFADSRIIDLVKEKMDSLPKPKDVAKGKGGKAPKPKPAKSVAAGGAVLTETSTIAGKTPPQKDSMSVILHNTRITTGKTNAVDISVVPKTVWGKQPTTSQLMSKIERRKELLSLEVDFDDFMMPFSQNIQRKTLELGKTTN
ncbi:hypothetical protein FQN60_015996 [Etheostoma spectabile]|uniref:EF-hand domain-containing protein n=1 Tax=Etheostoma spectabile TaxID=54343 RepID=A0A5J5CSN9_9PERO|nr:hypothetical protein FQN60_015996 [Etheostoma spectabile]